METAAAELHRRLWKPLQPHLVDAKTVLIAPDGILNQFPFAALPGQRPGSYLLEDLAIGYVTSGRHAVEIFVDQASRQCPVCWLSAAWTMTAAPDSVARPEFAKGVVLAHPRPSQTQGVPPPDCGQGPCRFCPVAGYRNRGTPLLRVVPESLSQGHGPAVDRCGAARGPHQGRVQQGVSLLAPGDARFLRVAIEDRCPACWAASGRSAASVCRGSRQDDELALAPLLRSGLVLAGASRPPNPQRTAGGNATGEDAGRPPNPQRTAGGERRG